MSGQDLDLRLPPTAGVRRSAAGYGSRVIHYWIMRVRLISRAAYDRSAGLGPVSLS